MNDSFVALVTGANRGIGFEVCRQLASRGYTVILTGRDRQKADQAAAEISRPAHDVHPLALNTTDVRSVRAAAEWLASRFGRLDVLVNNAGGNFDMENSGSAVSLEFVRETLEMNLLGHVARDAGDAAAAAPEPAWPDRERFESSGRFRE